MKKTIVLSLFIIFSILLSGCNNFTKHNNDQNDNNLQTDNSKNDFTNETSNISSNSNEPPSQDKSDENNNEKDNSEKKETIETPLYEFSTPLGGSPANRINNIQIACNTLNGTTIDNGQEFSFCKTVGKASTDKGYKKADVIIDRHIEQAVGGGMCQVSTTVYNTALGVPNIKITERHEHKKPVSYIAKGKDATISYGSLDLKFVNNTGNTIKIYASADNKNVNVKIVSVS